MILKKKKQARRPAGLFLFKGEIVVHSKGYQFDDLVELSALVVVPGRAILGS
jgi:hypothetical protein